MSDDVGPHLTSDDDDDTSKDLMTFCIQLVHHSQWKSRRIFTCGSWVEIPLYQIIGHWFGVNKDMLDMDRMTCNTNRYALHRSGTLIKTFTGSIIRIYTDDVHTGYVRLIREEYNTELRLYDLLPSSLTDKVIHGPAVLSDRKTSLLENKYSLSITSVDIAQTQFHLFKSFDDVFAVHSPYWPVEATEWITRRRSHGFPSMSVIKQVVRYGCDFVQVSHKLSKSYSNEWRFSFSRAELFITASWSTSQRIVYASLWVLNKRIGSRTLCT